MKADHAYFQVLCVLAACGHLNQPEARELREHALHCLSCRERIAETAEVSAQLFLTFALKSRSKRLPESMREHFATRAIREGVPLHLPSPETSLRKMGLTSILAVALFIIVASPKSSRLLRSGIATQPAISSAASHAEKSLPNLISIRPDPRSARVNGLVRSRAARRIDRGVSSPRYADAASKQSTQPSVVAQTLEYFLPLGKRLPDGLEPSLSNYRPRGPAYPAAPQIAGNSPQNLLAECERCAFSPATFRSIPGFAIFPGQVSPEAPASYANGTSLTPDFRLDPTLLHTTQNHSR